MALKKGKWFMALTLAVVILLQGFGATSAQAQAEDTVPAAAASAAGEREGLLFDPAEQNSVKLEGLLANVPATFEMYAKFAVNPNQRQILFGNYNANAASNFNIELKADNQFRYYELSNGKLIDKSTQGLSITTGQWTHLAVLRDPANRKVTLVQDGTVVATFENLDLPEKVELQNVHGIGTDTRNQMHVRAEIAEVRLWNDVRSLDELKDNAESVLTGKEEGLMHAWTLDKSLLLPGANVVYDKVGKLNGIPFGFEMAYEIEMPYESEFTGSGADFSNGELELKTEENLSAPPRSFEAWVNVPANTPAGQSASVVIGNNESYYYSDVSRLSFEIGANGKPRLYWRAHKSHEINYVVNAKVNVGDWVHVAIVLDDEAKSASAYINGRKIDEKALNVPIPTVLPARELKIGSDYMGYAADGKPQMNFKGQIADVRVWSTARTAEQIQAGYKAFLQGQESGLLGNWKLDQATNGAYPDLSLHGNDAQPYDNAAYNWLEPEFADGDYKIAVIPDTQYMARQHPNAMKAYFNWLKDNADDLNIKLAISVGDIVDTPSSEAEWAVAAESYSYLDGVIPYVVLPGNHDVVLNNTNLTRNYTNYNKYFPYNKYSDDATFGGAFVEGKMENTYHFFEIGDVEYMVLAMEFAPNDAVLAWANEVVAAHPDKRVIMSTHSYMYHNGEQIGPSHIDYPSAYIRDANNGDDMWNEFVSKHDNIVLVLSGHIGYPDLVIREDLNNYGSSVKQALVDAQFMEPRDLGMVMLMSIKEGSNDVGVNWYSVKNDKLFREKNQFSMELNLYPEPHSFEQLAAKLAEAEQFVASIESTPGLSLPKMSEFKAQIAAAKALTSSDDKAVIHQAHVDLTRMLVDNKASIVYTFLPKTSFTIEAYNSYDVESDDLPQYVLDGDYSTIWHTSWHDPIPDLPHWITIDMKESFKLSGIQRTSRPNLTALEFPKEFELYASDDLADLSDPAYLGNEANRASGTFGKTATGNTYQDFAVLDKPVQGRYVKLVVTSTYGTGKFTFMSEIDFTGEAVEDETIRLFADDRTVNKGSVFTVPVTVEQASKMVGLEGIMSFDSSLLTFESFDFAGFSATGAVNSATPGKISFVGVSGDALGTDEATIIANVTFRAKADLVGNATATISFANVRGVTTDVAGESAYVPVQTDDAAITIVSQNPGDLNGDDNSDLLDARAILKLIVSGGGSEAVLAKADINRDGTVDTNDVLMLLQMIADKLAE
ncbi:hypothetical protein PAT3040_02240 [Paenibacillus agaridevorans]|uniref:Dockerin domain-containing protein n=1 Tax=Paenibacillus agaridevorans TaxID=171404 RepID=A0A2R5EWC3_9BACL|nr:hypothetical protein PAT3040_02240 [Paenibacillus agaridevorans]